jgi:SPP1 gp7 family putative phage head morphogenesis protein
VTLSKLVQSKFDEVEKLIDSTEREVFKVYRKRRDEIYQIIQKNYAKYLTDVPKADYLSVMSLYQRLQKMEKEIKGTYVKLYGSTYNKTLAGEKQVFTEGYYRSQFVSTFFADAQGTSIKTQAINPLVVEASVNGDVSLLSKLPSGELRETVAQGLMPQTGETLSTLLSGHNQEGLKKTLQTIKQGLINGESYSKQTRRVKKVFDNTAYKASRVIRTEGNRNMNAGAYLNSQQVAEEIDIKRQWVATLDDRTRDRHASLDGVQVGPEERFSIGGDTALYPGGFSDPANSVNCRCTVIDVVPGIDMSVRRARNPVTGKSDIIGYQNYDEWKENIK